MTLRFLVGGGPGDVYGDSFEKVEATEVLETTFDGSKFMMLMLDAPISVKGFLTDHVLVKGRYVGQTLSDIRDATDPPTSSTVALYLLDPEEIPHADSVIRAEHIRYNGVGSCERIYD